MASVNPGRAVKNLVSLRNSRLIIEAKTYDLDNFANIYLVGFGKASYPMAQSIIDILGEYFSSGVIITKSVPSNLTFSHTQLKIIKGSHPIPDERSVVGANEIINFLNSTTENDLVIFLVSGGGSALLTCPVADVKLEHLQALTHSLLDCGANINEINTLRKHLSRVKGGGLARLAAPSWVVTLLLSDVVGDPLDVIASGPTVPDLTTYEDAFSVLRKYRLEDSLPRQILDHLHKGKLGKIPDTPKEGDPIFKKVQNVIIGNNYTAANSAMQQARQEGFNSLLLTTSLEGEARAAGSLFAAITRQIDTTGEPIPRPACVIAGGETTVTIAGNGKGGRNQELALSIVDKIAGIRDIMLVTLATDGEDGPTDAAGAVVTGNTLKRAIAKGLDPLDFLNRNDSYHFFNFLEDNLKPGPTGTNVCDLTFMFAF
jgi:hydroxypyruvate reductase